MTRWASVRSAGIIRTFALGALWGAGVAGIESILVNHSLRAGIQKPLSLLELVTNYAVYAGVAALILSIVLEVIFGRRAAAHPGGASPEPVAIPVRKRHDSPLLAELIVGSGLFVGALATYLQKGPWGRVPLTWPLALVIGVAGSLTVAVLVVALRRLSRHWMRTLRAAVALCLITGYLWMPLFGPYTGVLRSRQNPAPPGPAKNLLLIITDTLRADFLDCYGGPWGSSPIVNHLAASGGLFENNVAQSTWTLPATASILTGLYPSTHGAVATGLSLASAQPTLSEVLQRAGYRTAAFTENAYIRPQFGFGRGFDYFWTYWLPWVFDSTALNRVVARLRLPRIDFTNKHAYVTIPDIAGPEDVNWDARAATDAVLKWLRKDPDTPFFAYVHYMGPHSPYGPRDYLLEAESPETRLADYPRPMGGAFPLGGPAGQATSREIEEMKILYAADIRYVDYHIGRIIEWLEETGKLTNTVIVFTSDHGEEFLEHGSWNHGSSAFNEVARVPFIVRDGKSVPPGVRITDLTRQIDLMPTVLDLLDLDCPPSIQGRSVRPLLEGIPLDPVSAYVEVYPAEPVGSDISALVRGRYKIVHVSFGDRSSVLLYDLESDPKESTNLAELSPALRDSLLVEMEKSDQIARFNSPIDPERLKELRSLGYINQ
jgi:arylsulfatase A-like enzyme